MFQQGTEEINSSTLIAASPGKSVRPQFGQYSGRKRRVKSSFTILLIPGPTFGR